MGMAPDGCDYEDPDNLPAECPAEEPLLTHAVFKGMADAMCGACGKGFMTMAAAGGEDPENQNVAAICAEWKLFKAGPCTPEDFEKLMGGEMTFEQLTVGMEDPNQG